MDTVHIMLIGENVGHVYTAVEDTSFQKIKRIYLIHSPNSKVGKKIPYEKRAKEVKKKIEASSSKKVHLVPLSERGAFDKTETILAISKIVKKEYPSRLGSQQQIAVNITGGTNMMAVGAILAAASNKTKAYYVKDVNFAENQDLDTNLLEIGIPFKIKEDHTRRSLHKILSIISKSSFIWKNKPENRKYTKVERDFDLVKSFDGQYVKKWKTIQEEIFGRKIDNSILDTEWMVPQNIEGAILQKDLINELSSTAPNTIRNQVESLVANGWVIKKDGIPVLTNAKRSSRSPTEIFRKNTKEKLLVLTDTGRGELLHSS